MAISENGAILGKNKPARIETIMAMNASTKTFAMLTSLIFRGYFQGNRPHIEAAHHGSPAARHIWNAITVNVRNKNICADITTFI